MGKNIGSDESNSFFLSLSLEKKIFVGKSLIDNIGFVRHKKTAARGKSFFPCVPATTTTKMPRM